MTMLDVSIATDARGTPQRPSLPLGLVPSNRLLLCGLGAWLLIAIGGMVAIWQYETSAGRGALAPTRWPSESSITPVPGQPTLLMFAHPKCPCTQATIAELEQILKASPAPVSARLLFLLPAGEPSGWTDTRLIRQAQAIPGLIVSFDLDRAEAKRFGVETSGQTLLYDDTGHLLFAGGITPARGQEGRSKGSTALRAHLQGTGTSLRTTKVFGCPLSTADGNDQGGGEVCPLP